jgi:hypothetical protein
MPLHLALHGNILNHKDLRTISYYLLYLHNRMNNNPFGYRGPMDHRGFRGPIGPNRNLDIIKKKNLIFVSAQPDNIYFHWQVEVYMYQFSKFGIIDNCHVLFGYSGDSPSEGGLKLQKMYKNIHFYKDERVDKTYIPTIRPHILAKFFNEFPDLGKNVFYHDSDILFVRLPDFASMLNDNIAYLSDTVSYIGYNYIMECCKRYKDKFSELADDDLFIGMCKEVDINPNLIIQNQKNSGGAQYLLKNINGAYWEECERMCVSLYKYMCSYEQKYPIPHHIQKWTADMWAVLWNYWKIGGQTRIHQQLDFSWATDTMKDYNSKTIFHLAGVSGDTCKDKFYKALYTNKHLIDEYLKDNKIFDNVINTSATYGYTRIVIECANRRNSGINRTSTTSTTSTTTTTTTTTNSEKPIVEKTIDDPHLFFDRHHRFFNPFNIKKLPFNVSNNFEEKVEKVEKNKDVPNSLSLKKFIYISNNKTNTIKSKQYITKLVIDSTHPYGNTYIMDNNIKCCNKNIWRSIDNKYIIFFTGSIWIITYSTCESEIGPMAGGIASNLSIDLFTNKWNFSCFTNVIKEEI